jgi:hypothetical protein
VPLPGDPSRTPVLECSGLSPEARLPSANAPEMTRRSSAGSMGLVRKR